MVAEVSGLQLRPCSLKEANAFVGLEHRHHPPTRGHKFSVSVTLHGRVVGVAIAGRPVARALDPAVWLEVTRVCTDGTPNACSMLYGACRRAGLAMGYDPHQIITYTLASEPGGSLRASGWVTDKLVKGQSWHRPGRARTDRAPTEDKTRWRAA